MTLTWSTVCIKYLLFLFNLLFVITGIIIISVGVTIKAYYTEYDNFLDDKYFSTPNLLIAIGVIIFFIAFFGCCGAVKENYCMVLTFSSLLILIFILEFSAGISGYVLKNQTYAVLSEKLTNSLSKYNESADPEITKLWDTIQREFDCCGVNAASDWIEVLHTNATDFGVPLSCCPDVTGAIGTTSCTLNSTNIHTTGCATAFGNYIKQHAVTIGSCCLAIAFIQLLGIIFSCHLAKQIKLNYESV